MGAVLSKLWSDFLRRIGVGLVRSSAGSSHNYSHPTGNEMDLMDDSTDLTEYMDAETSSQDALMEQERDKHGESSVASDNYGTPEKPSASPSKIHPSSPLKSNWEENSDRPNPKIEKEVLPAEKKTKLEDDKPSDAAEISFEPVPNLQFGKMHETYRPESLSPTTADEGAPQINEEVENSIQNGKTQQSDRPESMDSGDLEQTAAPCADDKMEGTEIAPSKGPTMDLQIGNASTDKMGDAGMTGPVAASSAAAPGQCTAEKMDEDTQKSDMIESMVAEAPPASDQLTAEGAIVGDGSQTAEMVECMVSVTCPSTAADLSAVEISKPSMAQVMGDALVTNVSNEDTSVEEHAAVGTEAHSPSPSDNIDTEPPESSAGEAPAEEAIMEQPPQQVVPEDVCRQENIASAIFERKPEHVEDVVYGGDMEIDSPESCDMVAEVTHAVEQVIATNQGHSTEQTSQSQDLEIAPGVNAQIYDEPPSLPRLEQDETRHYGMATDGAQSECGRQSTDQEDQGIIGPEAPMIKGEMVGKEDSGDAQNADGIGQFGAEKDHDQRQQFNTDQSGNIGHTERQMIEGGDVNAESPTAEEDAKVQTMAIQEEMAGGDMASQKKVTVEQVCMGEAATEELAPVEPLDDGFQGQMETDIAESLENQNGNVGSNTESRKSHSDTQEPANLSEHEQYQTDQERNTIPVILISADSEDIEQYPQKMDSESTEPDGVTDTADGFGLAHQDHGDISLAEQVDAPGATENEPLKAAAEGIINEVEHSRDRPEQSASPGAVDVGPSSDPICCKEKENMAMPELSIEKCMNGIPSPEKTYDDRNEKPISPQKHVDSENVDPNRPTVIAEDSTSIKSRANQVAVQWTGDANEVFVAGSWADWSEKVELHKTGKNLWSGNIDLADDVKEIELKFIIDGNWVVSDDMPRRENKEGICNNYIKLLH